MSVEGPPREGSPRWETPALVAVLVLAAVLRFTGLGFGLRHQPHWDERVFVTSVARMLAAGDLDHRFYEYPGLVPYLLAPVLALLPADRREGPDAYRLARGLIAAFGVLSVALAGRLGRSLAGPWAGAAAALLLAVSPVEVITAHTIRPDVVLESFVLLAMLAFTRLGPSLGSDLRAGAALGAATAVKFSGALLAPAYVVARLLAPGPKLQRLLAASLMAALVFFAATPYALLHYRQFFGGIGVQWSAHYGEAGVALSFGEVATYYGRTIVRGLGPVGAALLGLGLLGAVRSPRAWTPLLAQVVVTLVVFSTADRRYERFLVPILGLLAVLAGEGVRRVSSRGRAWAGTALAAAALWPLSASVTYVRNVTHPGTRDLALDWIEAQLPEGTRVLNGVEDLGLPPGRFEVLTPTGARELDRILASSADITVWAGEPLGLEGFDRVYLAEPRGPESGPGIGLYRAPDGLKPRTVPVPLTRARLSGSSAAEDLPLLIDGRMETAWVAEGAQRPGEWIQVDLPEPVTLTRVELLLGSRPLRYGRNLHLLVSEDGASWTRVRVAAGRPSVEEQSLRGEGPSQVLWIEPRRLRSVRMVQAGTADRRWGIAELRLAAQPPD